jgi:hypothetical protein
MQSAGTQVDIIFTKGPGKYDQMTIMRGGEAQTIDCPKQRIIPHDMVHYAVEFTLQARGFLARVRDGEPADFSMGSQAESDGVERLVEVMQGDAWSGGVTSPEDMLDLYRVTCTARNCPMLPVKAGEILSIRDKLRELDAQWQALAVGESMSLPL